MSEQLKPGEYVGADGSTYLFSFRACRDGVGLMTTSPAISYPPFIPKTDLRTAAAALIALADELETETFDFFNDHYRAVMVKGEFVRLEHRPPSGNFSPVEDTYEHRAMAAAFRIGYRAGLDKEGGKSHVT